MERETTHNYWQLLSYTLFICLLFAFFYCLAIGKKYNDSERDKRWLKAENGCLKREITKYNENTAERYALEDETILKASQ